jgi:hypothetical protein
MDGITNSGSREPGSSPQHRNLLSQRLAGGLSGPYISLATKVSLLGVPPAPAVGDSIRLVDPGDYPLIVAIVAWVVLYDVRSLLAEAILSQLRARRRRGPKKRRKGKGRSAGGKD